MHSVRGPPRTEFDSEKDFTQGKTNGEKFPSHTLPRKLKNRGGLPNFSPPLGPLPPSQKTDTRALRQPSFPMRQPVSREQETGTAARN